MCEWLVLYWLPAGCSTSDGSGASILGVVATCRQPARAMSEPRLSAIMHACPLQRTTPPLCKTVATDARALTPKAAMMLPGEYWPISTSPAEVSLASPCWRRASDPMELEAMMVRRYVTCEHSSRMDNTFTEMKAGIQNVERKALSYLDHLDF